MTFKQLKKGRNQTLSLNLNLILHHKNTLKESKSYLYKNIRKIKRKRKKKKKEIELVFPLLLESRREKVPVSPSVRKTHSTQ